MEDDALEVLEGLSAPEHLRDAARRILWEDGDAPNRLAIAGFDLVWIGDRSLDDSQRAKRCADFVEREMPEWRRDNVPVLMAAALYRIGDPARSLAALEAIDSIPGDGEISAGQFAAVAFETMARHALGESGHQQRVERLREILTRYDAPNPRRDGQVLLREVESLQ